MIFVYTMNLVHSFRVSTDKQRYPGGHSIVFIASIIMIVATQKIDTTQKILLSLHAILLPII